MIVQEQNGLLVPFKPKPAPSPIGPLEFTGDDKKEAQEYLQRLFLLANGSRFRPKDKQSEAQIELIKSMARLLTGDCEFWEYT